MDEVCAVILLLDTVEESACEASDDCEYFFESMLIQLDTIGSIIEANNFLSLAVVLDATEAVQLRELCNIALGYTAQPDNEEIQDWIKNIKSLVDKLS